jgi:putative sterol carrier protein
MTTADPTAHFFGELGRRGHEPLLEKATGTLRFDLTNGKKTERWWVTVTKGDLEVSRRARAPDCTLRADKSVFDGIATGKVDPFAALLRGALEVDGDLRLVLLFRRLFTVPPAKTSRGPARR